MRATRKLDAEFFVHEDEEALVLQIELLNDCGITLSVWKSGDQPSVGIWHGNSCRSFNSEKWGRFDLKSFPEWLAIATGQKNDVPVPRGLLETEEGLRWAVNNLPAEELRRLGLTKKNNVVAFRPKDPPLGDAP